ncbi:protein fluG [Fusarium austroafricanum]|uniref:Protein fluG n=1 Tax=Fusarium austroafricanum TaxID=2364996 RepID=A0A8H4PAN0_9HYPO|nr:protein fluG [Fusarium austroafricanum]
MAIRAIVRISEEVTVTVGNIDYLLVPNPEATLDSGNPGDGEPKLFVVYVTKPSNTISKSALQEFRSSILDRDDVFQADFLTNIIFYGAKEEDVELESDALNELLVWKTRNWSFVEGRPDSKVAPGPHLLSLAVDRFLIKFPTQILVGFEIEFVLLDEKHNAAQSMDQTVGYSMTAGLRTDNLNIIEEIVDALQIALLPLPPMEAVDGLMVAQEIIRTITLRHDLRGTLAPKPILKGPKSGIHAHLSLGSLTPDAGEHFLAGALAKLRALCAFGLANFDSYERVAGDCAGEWVGFGTGNKDLPVRKVNDNRWEFRALDVTVNTYIFMAVLLFSGLHGIDAGLLLTSQDCQVVPSALSYKEAKRQLGELGIAERMPRNLSESLAVLKEDVDIETWVGNELLRQYLQVKEKEVEYFEKMADEDRRMKFLSYF